MPTVEDRNNNTARWNVYSLKEHFDLALHNLDEKIEQRFTSIKEAVDKADAATEKRFTSVNEFRNTLSDQQRTFIPRNEYEIALRNVDGKVTDVEKKVEKVENMAAGAHNVWAYVISAVSLLIALFAVILNLIKT